jgi:hypothetical protein
VVAGSKNYNGNQDNNRVEFVNGDFISDSRSNISDGSIRMTPEVASPFGLSPAGVEYVEMHSNPYRRQYIRNTRSQIGAPINIADENAYERQILELYLEVMPVTDLKLLLNNLFAVNSICRASCGLPVRVISSKVAALLGEPPERLHAKDLRNLREYAVQIMAENEKFNSRVQRLKESIEAQRLAENEPTVPHFVRLEDLRDALVVMDFRGLGISMGSPETGRFQSSPGAGNANLRPSPTSTSTSPCAPP